MALLSWLSAFPPISTSMYLPAIPVLQKTWAEPLAVVNLTLVGFFISYCFCLLIYGPLSDRYGRRRPLLAGISLFIASSLLCSLTDNVVAMIVLRVLQGAGAAAGSSLALAITKDAFEGDDRAQILAIIGTIMAIAPMLAPVFGGWVMAVASWRWIFVSQAIFGVIAWTGTFFMAETLKTRSDVRLQKLVGIYLKLVREFRYFAYLLMGSFSCLAHFAFIGGSADIYIVRFGLSAQTFSYFFAFNATAMMSGAFICSRVIRRFKLVPLVSISFSGIFIGGLILFFTQLTGPWALALPMAVMTFSYGFNRPLIHSLALEQIDENAGAASSLLTFSYFIVGAFSMWLIALEWSDKIRTIAVLGVVSSGLILICWKLMLTFGKEGRSIRHYETAD